MALRALYPLILFCVTCSLGRGLDLFAVSEDNDANCEDGVEAAVKYWNTWKETAASYQISVPV